MFESSVPGESPPASPRTFFGRDELIEKIVDLAQNLNPIALVGAGGIGKTSIALTVLHHDRIKRKFGHHRRFIRCDQFPTSRAHLLRRLSSVIGAGVENPEDLTPLRTFLSSKEMMIVLDNAESILDPRGTEAEEIYAIVEELSQFDNICICITSRISTTPPDCKRLDVPTLSMDAARDTFYRIYDSDDRLNPRIDEILEHLDFHPLSITLLATVAYQNKWDTDRVAGEWERQRTSVLQTEHNKSLAATIELSLVSPMFRELGPDARGLLGVIAFFPQGVDEHNSDWLFPTISNRTDIFNKFCILSLTYRSNEFVTMLAPLRDYLSPKDPKSSSLLCTTKDHYFTRMSVDINPNEPSFRESQWITLEDANVEHLLDVFTTVDANSDSVWYACANFMDHLNRHKKRLVTLKPKIEGLSDDHRSKPHCLFELSQLFYSLGKLMESKRLVSHALELYRERGDDLRVALALRCLSDTNRLIGLPKEGIRQAREALEIIERFGDAAGQAECLVKLGFSLHEDNQLDAAEEAALGTIDLLPEKRDQFLVCTAHRLLGSIYQSRGNTEEAIYHFEVALEIASPFNWHDHMFWIHYKLAALFCERGRLHDANDHIDLAESHMLDNAYHLACAVELQARIWHRQDRLEEARSEALRAAEVYEGLGAAKEVEDCRELLQWIEEDMNRPAASDR
jgi:tetratricopeptide (TPR) repeat protein